MIPIFFYTSFPDLLQFILQHNYSIVFFGMVFEGTMTTIASSFAASLGYFNIYAIFILSLLGDFVGDTIWYILGYYFGHKIIKKDGKYIHMTESKVNKLKKLLEKHPTKIIFAIKLSPAISIPGLLTIGMIRMSFLRFIIVAFIVTFIKTILFVLVGYFGGSLYEEYAIYLNDGLYVIGILLLILFFIQYIYKKGSSAIVEGLEDEV